MAPLTLLTPVLTHLNSAYRATAAGVSCFVLHARIVKSVETGEAIAEDARSGLDVAHRIVLDRLFGEGGNAPQLRVNRSTVTRFDGYHERGLVGRSAPSFPSFFATLIGIVDLHLPGKLVDGIALLHHFHQLLLHEPGGVPFDVELTSQFESGDIVLRARHQVHGEEPFHQRRARFVQGVERYVFDTRLARGSRGGRGLRSAAVLPFNGNAIFLAPFSCLI
jgi:hypothetical protein